MESLTVQPIRTRLFHVGENLSEFVVECVSRELVREKMILAVTSKIVSLAEGRLVARDGADKAQLVREEADEFFGEIGYGCFLTIKEGLFIPSAGIDESNSESGDYILYPRDPKASCRKLWDDLKRAWDLDEFGVVLTDSHTTPLRRGVTGISLAHFGFRALKKLVGTKDLFGRELKMTNMNLADGLAASAVMMMGEGAESQPLAVVSGFDLEFTVDANPQELRIPMHEDLYAPFFARKM